MELRRRRQNRMFLRGDVAYMCAGQSAGVMLGWLPEAAADSRRISEVS
jgi:hypothetical protein